MIFHIYDDITKRVNYVRCSEKSLNNIGIREWEGRYRYTLYDYDYKKETKSVDGIEVISLNRFKGILSQPS